MRTKPPTDLGTLFFGAYRRQVLGLLLLHPDESFHLREIARVTNTQPGTLRRELAQLAQAGVLAREKVGNLVRYQADPACPIYDELREIAQKTLITEKSAGTTARVARRLRRRGAEAGGKAALRIPQDRLKQLCRRYHIRKLALFGSAARGELGPESDVDLIVEFSPNQAPSLWDSPGMDKEFSALFGQRPVDMVPPEVLRNPYRRKTIERDLKVLYEAK